MQFGGLAFRCEEYGVFKTAAFTTNARSLSGFMGSAFKGAELVKKMKS